FCELCEHPFTFTPIYRGDMPERVPARVLLQQCLRRTGSLAQTTLRAIVVMVVWLVLLPFLTLWVWRLLFWSGERLIFPMQGALTVDASETRHLFDFRKLLVDCFEGQIITVFVIVVFVAAYLFREWVIQNMPAEAEEDDPDLPDLVHVRPNHPIHQLQDQQVAVDTLITAMNMLPEGGNGREHDRINEGLEDIRRELGQKKNIEDEQDLTAHQSGIKAVLGDRLNANQGQIALTDHASSASFSANHVDTLSHLHTFDGSDDRKVNTRRDSTEGMWPSSASLNNDADSVIEDQRAAAKGKQRGEWEEIPWEELARPAENSLHDHDNQTEGSESSWQRYKDTYRHRREAFEEAWREDAGTHVEAMWRNRGVINDPAVDNEHEDQNMDNNEEDIAADGDDEEEPFDIGEDIDGVLEAIGMRGNILTLVQNSTLMCLMISLCLAIAVWIPYVVGRLVILVKPISIIQTPIYVMRLVTDPVVDFTLDRVVPFVWSNLLKTTAHIILPENIRQAMEHIGDNIRMLGLDTSNQTESVQKIGNDFSADFLAGSISTVDWSALKNLSTTVVNRWHQFATERTGLDRTICVLVGYAVVILVGSWYLGRSRSVRRRENSVQVVLRQQGVFLKVLFFITIELVIFPAFCGFLLDLVASPAFADFSRWRFYQVYPYTSAFLHWFLGTGFLFHFAVFITLCREVIRPGVMWFIRDPNDPQFHPIQEMADRPMPRLLRKISQSIMMYSIVIAVGVGVSTFAICQSLDLFPLRLPYRAPLSTLALDLLALQFISSPLMTYLKPRETFKKLLLQWWRITSRRLRLTSFMFNGRYPEEEGVHVRMTWKAWLFQEQASINDTYDDVSINQAPVLFKRDGQLVRVPKYDSVPVIPGRRMLVPVDPVTLEAVNETERRQGHPAASESGDHEHTTTIVYIPPHFQSRIILFLVLLWLSGLMLACLVIVAPGRRVFDAYLMNNTEVHDIYSFTFGLIIMLSLGTTLNWISHKFAMLRAGNLCYVIGTFGLVIPLLSGIAVDLYILMPLRDSKLPLQLNISQDWSLGVALLGLLYGAVSVLPNNAWRRGLDQVLGNGMLLVNPWGVTRSVVLSVTSIELAAIVIPGILAWGLGHVLDDPLMQLVVFRCIYPIVFFLSAAVMASVMCSKLFDAWMRKVRDDAYMIGKRLHNIQEDTQMSAYSELSPVCHHPSSSGPHVGRMPSTAYLTKQFWTDKSRLLSTPSTSPSSPSLTTAPSTPTIVTNVSTTPTTTSSTGNRTCNFTWLVFMNEKWVPFDVPNQAKLEQTLSLGGTFVDINDSHFPDVKRVRVFPKNNYLSYLGVKYRLSRIMQPDAWLDHVNLHRERENKKMEGLIWMIS
ncbi:hypothetical protein DFQ28_010358, partial [Apophysomyces sp. BC1034]